MLTAPIYSINRHRINTDGYGVRTLVAFRGCPLNCKFCINPESKHNTDYKMMTTEELYDVISQDDMYMMAAGGGVTFGGGEPLLHADFIQEFIQEYGYKTDIVIETSLNVPSEKVKKDWKRSVNFIVDIKDLNRQIYQEYTGKSNSLLIENLEWLMENYRYSVKVRVPHIPGYNTDKDIEASKRVLRTAFDDFTIDEFEYLTDVLQVTEKESFQHGKDVCRILKDIRKRIADVNGIELEEIECNNTQPCYGTCPACEQQYEYLKRTLIDRYMTPQKFELKGVYEGIGNICTDSNHKYESVQHHLMGYVITPSKEEAERSRKFHNETENESWALKYWLNKYEHLEEID